jgi:cytochrome c-type biogenesis protein CcmF
MVRYIWLGALIMALGGIVAVTDRRYRTKRVTAADAATAAGTAPAR